MNAPLDDDDELAGLVGFVLPGANASYHVHSRIASGGMASAMFAMRRAADGEAPCVLKVLRPSLVTTDPGAAALSQQKETVALQRLNQRVPPSPFVVRLLEHGVADLRSIQLPAVPWLALEYIHGGHEGTTLADRIAYGVRTSQCAFEPARVAHAIDCLTQAIEVIHAEGIIHRDLKPTNVLCCGVGEREVFKVTDFGVARPPGQVETFAGLLVGTPGYAPPEQAGGDRTRIGPWSDVFAFAALIFEMLTGTEMFPGANPWTIMGMMRKATRPSIRDSSLLSKDLVSREAVCQRIDEVLARATNPKPEDRPRSARELGALLIPHLTLTSERRATLLRRAFDFDDESSFEGETVMSGWVWTSRHRAPTTTTRRIRSVAWEPDGNCMALTDAGLEFWNGTDWLPAPMHNLPRASGLRFVRRTAPGRWLVGGDRATIAVYTREGIPDLVQGSDPVQSLVMASGDLDDLGVMVGTKEGAAPALFALTARRWLRPVSLTDVSSVHALARIEDAKWLVAGTALDGSGWAAIYSPLAWSIDRIEGRPGRTAAPYACAIGSMDRGAGFAATTRGQVVFIGAKTIHDRIDREVSLTAAAIDANGRAWVASQGAIWTRRVPDGSTLQKWRRVWFDDRWTTPIVGLFTDHGRVIALREDGEILEGRSLQPIAARRPRNATEVDHSD